METVFVSSTSQDLALVRNAILKAIRKLEMSPVAMEDFSAADDAPWTLVRKKIQSVDWFIVVIAHRYGSVDERGIGFTEREYDYAVRQRIPVLAFVIDDQANWPAKHREQQAQSKQSLERFKQKVLSRTADRWKRAAELPNLVMAALSKASKARSQKSFAPVRPPANNAGLSGELLGASLKTVPSRAPKGSGRPSRAGSKLTVVIPCGGSAGSLFPMTQVMPKCLVLVENKTILQHILDSLMQCSDLFDQVIVATGNVNERKDYHDAIDRNVQQSGYGERVRCMNIPARSVPDVLLKLEENIKTDNFLMHYNDILLPHFDWRSFVEKGLANGRQDYAGTLVCSQHYPLKIGVIKRDAEGLVSDFEEKPQSLPSGTLANAAVAIFATRVIKTYCQSKHDSFFVGPMASMLRSRERIDTVDVREWFHIQDWNALYEIQEKRLYKPASAP